MTRQSFRVHLVCGKTDWDAIEKRISRLQRHQVKAILDGFDTCERTGQECANCLFEFQSLLIRAIIEKSGVPSSP